MAKTKTQASRGTHPAKPSSQKRHSKPKRKQKARPPAEVKSRLQFEWSKAISPGHWEIYLLAIQALRAAEVKFILGGGFSMATFTGRWRNTKDIDLYICSEDREKAIEALSRAGFKDYFDLLPYNRKWIYRSVRSGLIVDIIWAMANQRAQVDELWFQRAETVLIRGETLGVVPVEEFIWCKLYILQRDHCDWTDIMNVLFAASTRVDWDHLLWRLEDDWPLLKGLLYVYGWVCPKRARLLPERLRRRLNLEKPEIPRRPKLDRIRLLDSRGWFAALLEPNQPLEI
jgi:hypothetical protein